MEADIEKILIAYKNAKKEGKDHVVQVLESIFGEEIFKQDDITRRVKTFEDAYNCLDKNHNLIKEYDILKGLNKTLNGVISKDLIAYLKLRIICTVLNEGWNPSFNESEIRYFPLFYIYSESQCIDDDIMSDSMIIVSNKDNYKVLDCKSANTVNDYVDAGSNRNLCFKSPEIAKYCGKQFTEIWSKFIFG